MRDTCDRPLLSLLKPMRPVYLLWGQDWLLNRKLVPLGHSINNDWDWCPKPLFYWVKACHICLCQLFMFKLRKSESLQIQVEAKATTVDTTYTRTVNYASRLPVGCELSPLLKQNNIKLRNQQMCGEAKTADQKFKMQKHIAVTSDHKLTTHYLPLNTSVAVFVHSTMNVLWQKQIYEQWWLPG